MCGICGVLSFDQDVESEDTLTQMLRQMEGRGPDDHGMHIVPGTALGHRRLSIIDLSQAGHQPMIDPELGLAITYNGEIYNYRQLKDELLQYGYTFRTGSDTEVLLKAYAHWGERFVEKLYGMYAFCLHDQKQRRWLLARDRLGIKPLYYVDKPNKLSFASSIQALLAARQFQPDLAPQALHYYLSFHAVVPAPMTIFREVKKLEPGTYLMIEEDGRRRQERYWQLNYSPQPDVTEEEWVDRLLSVLRASVKRRLVSDVPVGALLSGGLDSSLIVALMREELDDVRTYSIGFEDVESEEGNEFVYSDLVAQTFATEHQKIFVDSRQLLTEIRSCVRAMAEPQVSHDAVGFYLLSREVSKRTKVVLSGQGADEVFAGYHWYPKMQEQADPLSAYQAAFFDRSHTEVQEALTPPYHAENVSELFVKEHFSQPGADDPVDKALRLDTGVMLVEDPVKRVDNMTMAWGLEARVPFLDHEVVELAAAIPSRFKLDNGGKGILKKAAERCLPHDVIYRKKGYFPVPALKYLQGEYHQFACDVLLSDTARERRLFDRDYVEKMLKDPDDHITILGGSKLWQLTLLDYWLQQIGA
ncbi:N-acetylglutaminylglutamine amidotransferase [Brevibacillus humidisoli]|uniref:N-acetylglutaminylglutamine amidotransferase n=1 Tax=Brevibacillus humidisoli TaxID=2895522 RepID=UPI001E5544B8|nr:N-acetylglutaminylglutamine amidotransferase [Brevibacillus humidisoli]UFJ41691.1 N-acetylglutaminylglutamine amidotransferase [Brevibacillus humidisoli]